MASKIAIAVEELDESLYWLDLLIASGDLQPQTVAPILEEGEQILRILVSSLKTLRQGNGTLQVKERMSGYVAMSIDEEILLSNLEL